MPNEFIVKNGLISQGNVTVSGSISTTSPLNLSGSLNIDGNINLTGSRTIQTVTGSATSTGPSLSVLAGNGGSSSGNGGILTLKGGNAVHTSGIGGDVYIQGGDKTGSQRSGYIYIGAQSNAYPIFLYGSSTFSWDGPNAQTAVSFQRGGLNRFIIYDDVNLNANYFFRGGANTINAIWDTWNSVIVRGKGATSATTAFQVQNANASASLAILDNGFIGINTGSAQYNLDVNGTARVSGVMRIGVTPITGTWSQMTIGNGGSGGTLLTFNGYVGISDFVIFGTQGLNAHPSAQVEIKSTTLGFLPPRTNLTSNISTPAQGLMTYVNSGSNEGLYYYNSGSAVGWHKVLTNSGSQEISGSLNITGSLDVSGSVRISGQYTNKNGNDNSTAPIALRTIGNDNSGISIYKASFGHTNAIQFLSNDLTNRFSIGQGYIGVTNSLDFNIGRFASSAWSNAFTIFNATGNISINSTTDAGFKLDVNGTARVVNQATIQTLTVGLGGGAVSTNTAIGVSSLLSNTTGFDNSSFGWESLKSVTTGLFNSAFGVQALRSFVTGAHNSAFGNCALFSATGSRNSSLGSCAFYSLSSGNDNTSLGNNSGRYIAGGATANTTSNNSIFIGSDTKALADNQTNQIVIGYNETGLGSNTTIIGNSSTTLTALRGNVLINTTTDAGFKLDVNGTARVSGDLTVSSNTIVVGKGVSTGTFNTVLGTAPLGAGGGSSTCNYTVAVGRTAGYLCASGGANVMVGTEVAQLAPSISYSTLIGSKIFGSVTSSITQVLAIGTGDTNNYYPTIYATNIYSNSPNVRIGNNGGALASVPSAITASAILELSSTTKGFLPPRMTGAQAELISSPAEGLMVYSTDGTGVTITSKGWWGFDGATWVKFN